MKHYVKPVSPWVAFSILLLIFPVGSFGLESREVRHDAAAIEKDARLVSLKLDREKNAIMLDDTELVEDDGPGSGVPEGMDERAKERPWVEALKKGIVIKKILTLDNPAAFSARLLFEGTEAKGNREPLHISLNGVEFLRPASLFAFPYTLQYTEYTPYDCWYFIDLPVGALRKGENEVLLWAESDSTSWKVHISAEKEFARGSLTRTHHPNRSLKSSDGGKTWSDSRLGPQGNVDGEYSVRFSLNHHVRSGQYISPVMDIVNDHNPLKRKIRLEKFRFTVGMETPEGTAAAVQVRFGASPRADDPSWTPWSASESSGEFTGLGNRRYFQWKAALSSTNPLKTPKIKNCTLAAAWEDLSPNKEVGVSVEVVRNGHVARSSYPFTYENILHPELEKYRRNAQLDKVVEGASSEFEVMMRLLNWAYRIPVTSNKYSWNWNDVTLLEKGEKGIPRLQMDYKARRRDAMCLYSNQALIGALLSFGHQARHININGESENGHEVTEVWSNEFNKWIYLDATRDYYYFDRKTGNPLNLLEVHKLLAARTTDPVTWDRPSIMKTKTGIAAPAGETSTVIISPIEVGIREGVNPYRVVTDARHILEITGYFRIIPRNDFLSHPLPVPVHTGASAWGWDGFLNHYDEKYPRRGEYHLETDRALDFYEPLNQAEVYLNETVEHGVLNVEVNTFTPGFDTFQVRLNEGKWVEQKQPVWLLALKAGKNCLEVRVRNLRGVLGPVSKLYVTYNP
ncbi:MAG: hypothetical protein Q8O92_00495 [Candidatus Latescibacter sp.]|nr:hypothetical protein [Candidatus Latescibacter sp.]